MEFHEPQFHAIVMQQIGAGKGDCVDGHEDYGRAGWHSCG
jgi:hypothetical protein